MIRYTTNTASLSRHFASIAVALMLSIVMFSLAVSVHAFNSGSDGSDGALDYTPFAQGPVTVIFDPTDPSTFDHPTAPNSARRLDPDGDNIYHFTTITIPSGVTVRLRADTPLGSRAVHWLASGAVQIDGAIDLNGERGQDGNNIPIFTSAVAGAGGYYGGISRATLWPASDGFGPGAGRSVVGNAGGGAGHATVGGGKTVARGIAYGNDFLLPLLGGSGGSGGAFIIPSGGGGAGGGALLIASSVSITLNAALVSANGGLGGSFNNRTGSGGGGGSGGAIRLMAPTISGTGNLRATGGSGGRDAGGGSNGRIRLEAFNHQFTGSVIPTPRVVTPGPIILPTVGVPSVRVVSIGGIPLPAQPIGSFITPDVTVGADTVGLEIEASFIPLGTVVTLQIFSEGAGAQTVDSTPLAGTLENSSATATAILPHGFSRFYVQASWQTAP